MSFAIAHHHKKIRDIGLGLVLYEAFNNVFDLVFYPLALTLWGIVIGGIVATGLSLVINTLVFWLYDHMRVDWLGAHALRQLEEEENKSNLEKLITWLGKEKRSWHERILSPLVFIALTLPIDPVIVAIHHRKQHFKGVTARDWSLLAGATLAANLWWIAKLGLVIACIEWLWHIIFRALFG